MQAFKDCNNCSLISITEEEQQRQGNQYDHICKRTGKRLFHHSKHPIIPTPDDCMFSENYKNAEESDGRDYERDCERTGY